MKLQLPRNKVFAAVLVLFGVSLSLIFLPVVVGLVLFWVLYKKVPKSRMKIAGMALLVLITLSLGGIWIAGLSSSKAAATVQGTVVTVSTMPTLPATPPVTPTPTISIPKATVVQTISIPPTATSSVVQQLTPTSSSSLRNNNSYTK